MVNDHPFTDMSDVFRAIEAPFLEKVDPYVKNSAYDFLLTQSEELIADWPTFFSFTINTLGVLKLHIRVQQSLHMVVAFSPISLQGLSERPNVYRTRYSIFHYVPEPYRRTPKQYEEDKLAASLHHVYRHGSNTLKGLKVLTLTDYIAQMYKSDRENYLDEGN